MKIYKKDILKASRIFGAVLLGCAVLCDDKEARVGLSLAGTACIFPEQSVKVIKAVGQHNINSSAANVFSKANSVIKNQPVSEIVTKVGIIRRTYRSILGGSKRFWQWVY